MAASLNWDGPLGPLEATRQVRVRQRMAGQQAGALSHKAALPPVLSYGLTMDEHYKQAEALLERPTPTEALTLLDYDLQFAAQHTATSGGQPGSFEVARWGS